METNNKIKSVELKNMYHVNFIPDGFGRDCESQSILEAFKRNIDLNCQFTNAKANTSAKEQITSGE